MDYGSCSGGNRRYGREAHCRHFIFVPTDALLSTIPCFALTGWKTGEINGIEFGLNSPILVEKWKENRNVVLSYRDKGE